MKKVFLFLMLTVMASTSFVSCSDDDKAPKDPIIGNWKITNAETECEKLDVFTFNENGVFSRSVNEKDDKGTCVADKSAGVSGSWVNIGNSQYSLNFIFESDDEDFNQKETFKAAFNGNTVTLTNLDDNKGIIVLIKI